MKTFAVLSTLLATVAAHGRVLEPPAREVGDAFKAACGEQTFNNAKGDADGNQQQLEQIAKNQKDFDPAACNLGLCKGFQFADVAPANVQAFTAGQVVPIKAEIKAPHPGVANVSVVDTATNAIIGEPLLVFDEYSKGNIPANNTAFEITMPDVAATCGTAGACVVQWWWDSEEAGDAGQTYMSCIDFTM